VLNFHFPTVVEPNFVGAFVSFLTFDHSPLQTAAFTALKGVCTAQTLGPPKPSIKSQITA
jgi:hypothetical protein